VGRRGLGRGLSALISAGESVGGLRFEEVPVSAIRPNSYQPRRNFEETGIKELAASIREVGILQPLVIRSTESGFELIAGERRLRAAKVAGLERVPVLIREAAEGESMELALVENLQREDLNPLETATAYQALMDSFGLTKEQLAARLGKSRPAITNTLGLLRLPESIREMLLAERLTEGHARALRALEDEGAMLRLAERVQAEKLSVRNVEDIVRQQLSHGVPEGAEPTAAEAGGSADQRQDEYAEAARRIQESLGLQARVKPGRRGGKVEVRFRNREELEGLLALLTSAGIAR
jgi:ParB family transcriptional regulator, chromosome partitioning protein